MGFLSIFFSPSPFLYYDLSFEMQKPSYVTNIHWKFHDFFPLEWFKSYKGFADGVVQRRRIWKMIESLQSFPFSHCEILWKNFYTSSPIVPQYIILFLLLGFVMANLIHGWLWENREPWWTACDNSSLRIYSIAKARLDSNDRTHDWVQRNALNVSRHHPRPKSKMKSNQARFS